VLALLWQIRFRGKHRESSVQNVNLFVKKEAKKDSQRKNIAQGGERLAAGGKPLL
jgi:hypothetical protein